MIRWAIVCALLFAPIAAMAQTGQQPTYLGLSAKISLPPPPPPPIVGGAQIHNASGWLPNHIYAAATGPFTRVNSGLGWNPATGTWNPGQVLGAYQLTSGSCTSGTTMPTGVAASIQDGSCTWKYLSPTDYISITGWASDNQPWVAATYGYHDVVVSDTPLRAYMQISATCPSTIRPIGIGTTYSADGDGNSLGVGADGCQWVHIADVLYTSGKSYIPTQTYNLAENLATVHVLATYTGLLWNDQEYIAGQNGEKSPIEIRNHNSYFGESPGIACGGPHCGRIVIESAPGEGFADGLKPTDPLKGFDPTKGVAVLMNDAYRWPVEPDGLYVENSVDIIGLQIMSLHGSAVGDINGGSNNDDTVQNCICDGGHTDQWTTPTAISLDTGSAVTNSLVISHANAAVVLKYPGFILHSTLVNPAGTGDVGVETGNRWVFNDTTVADTAIFGFAHAGAGNEEPGTGFSPTSANNVTDAPVGDSGLTTWAGTTPPAATVVAIPGTAYGSSAAAAFMNPGSDYRPKLGGPLAGTGSAYGPAGLFCAQQSDPTCLTGTILSFDTPDIIGTARPQNGLYDVGASQGVN